MWFFFSSGSICTEEDSNFVLGVANLSCLIWEHKVGILACMHASYSLILSNSFDKDKIRWG